MLSITQVRGEFNRKLNKRMNKAKALPGGKWKNICRTMLFLRI